MKKIDMLDFVTYDDILNLMLSESEIKEMKELVTIFYQREHHLPYGVLNAILIRSIMSTKEHNRLPNEAYLRKVAETFKEYKVTTTAQAIMYLEKNAENAFLIGARRKVKPHPEWVDEYLEGLKDWK